MVRGGCKVRGEYDRRYRETHAKESKQRNKIWRENNPDKVKEYRKKNLEKTKLYNKKYREQNSEKVSKGKKMSYLKKRSYYILKQRRYTENNRLAINIKRRPQKREYMKRYLLDPANKIKERARRLAHRKIPLKSFCSICKTTNGLERHHWRYNKPLLVSTLCGKCHSIQHMSNLGGGNHCV